MPTEATCAAASSPIRPAPLCPKPDFLTLCRFHAQLCQIAASLHRKEQAEATLHHRWSHSPCAVRKSQPDALARPHTKKKEENRGRADATPSRAGTERAGKGERG